MIKIGNLWGVLFFCCLTTFSTTPFLRLSLPSGELVSHVAAQQPVFLELVSDQPVQGVSPHGSIAPFVNQTSQASSYKSINGIASREYIHRWHLVFPKPQVVTVGPLIVHTDSGPIHVPELVITVVPPHDHAPMVRIEYDHQPVVTGEWSSVNFVFVLPAGARCSELSYPASDSIMLRVNATQRSRILRSGKAMDEIRYRIEWMSKVPGNHTIGPVSISYASEPQGLFGLFGRFVAEQIKLSAEPLSVVVSPLPGHDGTVHAVGDIQKLFIKAAHAKCFRGAGVSVDLCIIGPCTLLVDPAELLPTTPSYAVYTSHQEHIPGAFRSIYTVKPELEGDIVCLVPDVTFFNTRTRQYETIAVEPLVLHVHSQENEANVLRTEDCSDHAPSSLMRRIVYGVLVCAILACVFAFFFKPLSLFYAIRRVSNSDLCAHLYGELCSLWVHEASPYEAAQQALNAGTPPVSFAAAKWYLEQRYAYRPDWHCCRDAAREMHLLQFLGAYLFQRLKKNYKKLGLFLLFGLLVGLILFSQRSDDRCRVVKGTPLYYLPQRDSSLVAGTIAADAEAVILEKRDQWIFIRCAFQRGWVDCSESATPGG